MTPRQLTNDLEALAAAGFTWASLDDCADWLAGTITLPPRTAIVTFDDGYASVASAALPVLQRLRVPATVFVVAGRIGSDNQWPGQWPAIGRARLLDAGALRALTEAGVALAGLLTHPRLTELDDARRRRKSARPLIAWSIWRRWLSGTSRIPTASEAHERLRPLAGGIARPSAHRAASSIASAIRSTCHADAHDLRVAMRLGLLKTPWLAHAGAAGLRVEPAGAPGPGGR